MSSKYIQQKGSQEKQKSKKELKRLEEERKKELEGLKAQQEAEQQAHVEFEEMEEIVDISKVEQTVENNYKTIIAGALGAILLAAAVIFFLGRGKNKDVKYAKATYTAQNSFASQKWDEALNGTNGELGFIEIANKYKGSNTGNMANYYAGIAYMKKGDFDKAIEFLKKFNTTGDANVNALAFMNLADAQMEKGEKDAALANYNKAASFDSAAMGDAILYRFGLAQFKAGQTDEAKATFQKLVNNYPLSRELPAAQQYLKAM